MRGPRLRAGRCRAGCAPRADAPAQSRTARAGDRGIVRAVASTVPAMSSTVPPPVPTEAPPVLTEAPPSLALSARVFEVPPDQGTVLLPASLQISIVTYRPDFDLLARCFRTLEAAIAAARADRAVRTVALALVDNSGDRAIAHEIIQLAQGRFGEAKVQLTYLHGHANIGYGAAHNLALHGSGADYHLVLNPDVELERDAIAVGVRWLAHHADVGALAPEFVGADGLRIYLCKRYPAVLDLLLRGFAPRFVRALFRRRLARYEMRDVIDPAPGREVIDIPAMSGACLLVKRHAIDSTGGFDPGFFLYFEDFDWTVRLNRVTRTAYVPAMHVLHHGGGAARKGLSHIGWFVRSGVRFYRKHGWRLA
jgi:GT2 family glycosyltransferase